MTDTETALRDALTDALADADYPVETTAGLAAALPKGPLTKFDVGDRTFSAASLATTLSGHENFPYEDVEAVVDDVIAGLKAEGEL